MPSDIIFRFIGDTKEFNAKVAETQAKMGELSGKSEQTGLSLRNKLGLVGVAAIGAIAIASYELADKYETAHARLEVATKNTGGNFEELKGSVNKTETAMGNLGFGMADVDSSLASLTIATGSTEKAQKLQALAADLARFKHEDLATATDTLVKIEGGRLKGLAALGISTKDATGQTITTTEALRRLAEVTKGQATAYTHTFGGELEVMKTKLENVGTKIGLALIPVLQKLVNGIGATIDFFGRANAASDGFLGKLALFGTIGAVAVLATIQIVGAIGSLIGIAGAAAGAIKGMAETMYLLALENPVIAATLAVVAVAALAVTAAMTLFGGGESAAAKAAGDLNKAMQQQNETLGQAAAQAVSQLIDKHKDLRTALDQSGVSAGTVLKAIQGDKGAYDEVTRAIDEYSARQLANGGNALVVEGTQRNLTKTIDNQAKAYTLAKEKAAEQSKANKSLNETTKDNTTVTKVNSDTAVANAAAKQSTAEIQNQLVFGLQASKIGFDNETASMSDTDDKAKALATHLKDLNDLTLAAANSDIGYQQALLQVGDALQTANEKSLVAIASKGKDSAATRDNDAAQLALKSSLLGVVGAAEKNASDADKSAIAHGHVVSAVKQENDKHAAAYLALQALKGQYPALSGLIADYERKLGLIPRSVDTRVTVNGTVASAAAVNALVSGGGFVTNGGVKRRALGGPVGAGEAYLVGEQGPEMFVSSTAGNIVPKIGGGSRGGVVVHAVVQVSNRDDGTTIVTKLIDALRVGTGASELRRLIR